jgi:NADPH:quinone reductase-like Zn-dependent oxidoreductase
VSRHGGPDVLRLIEEDLPEPAAGEARVRVQAAGVSAFDLMYRRSGRLPGSPKVPFTLGEDIVGFVDKLGESVAGLDPGQRVAGGTWTQGVGGGYAEHVCLPARDLVPVPDRVDAADAVCLVANYLTAHLHLHYCANVRSGDRILVHGAAGGVGSALLELGRLSGLEMFGTASRRDHELVSRLGATPIDYRNEDFVERIRDLTADGVDVVIDPVGGARQLWRSYRTLRHDGRLVWLGSAASKGRSPWIGLLSLPVIGLLKLVPDGKRVPLCPDLGRFAETHHDWYRETLADLLDLLAAGELKPVVSERIPLAEAARAHELLERGGCRGKLVLVAGHTA